jgi:hypothetical protein
MEGDHTGKRRFKAYSIGYFHIDSADVRAGLTRRRSTAASSTAASGRFGLWDGGEGDESDGSFFRLDVTFAVVTNIRSGASRRQAPPHCRVDRTSKLILAQLHDMAESANRRHGPRSADRGKFVRSAHDPDG